MCSWYSCWKDLLALELFSIIRLNKSRIKAYFRSGSVYIKPVPCACGRVTKYLPYFFLKVAFNHHFSMRRHPTQLPAFRVLLRNWGNILGLSFRSFICLHFSNFRNCHRFLAFNVLLWLGALVCMAIDRAVPLERWLRRHIRSHRCLQVFSHSVLLNIVIEILFMSINKDLMIK